MHPFLKAAQEITVIIAAGIAAPGAAMTVDTAARRVTIETTADMVFPVAPRKRAATVTAPAERRKTPKKSKKALAEDAEVAAHVFSEIWRDLVSRDLDIAFSPRWGNKIGQFECIPADVKLEPGSMRASFDNCGRKMILVGSIYGTVVVFKRYSDESNNEFCYNAPSLLEELGCLDAGPMTAATMKFIIGDNVSDLNIGNTQLS